MRLSLRLVDTDRYLVYIDGRLTRGVVKYVPGAWAPWTYIWPPYITERDGYAMRNRRELVRMLKRTHLHYKENKR